LQVKKSNEQPQQSHPSNLFLIETSSEISVPNILFKNQRTSTKYTLIIVTFVQR